MEEKGKINKGGRPKLEKKRDKRVVVRFYEHEYEDIQRKAIRLNCSLAELLREAALNVKVLEKKDPKELMDVKIELRKIGANVNQIARKLNQNTQINSAFLKKDIENIKENISDTLEKL